jgi:hypothetical protein
MVNTQMSKSEAPVAALCALLGPNSCTRASISPSTEAAMSLTGVIN